MHQDIWNRKFCGEGVPDWAAQKSHEDIKHMAFPWPLDEPYEVDENDYPSLEICKKHQWEDYHFS